MAKTFKYFRVKDLASEESAKARYKELQMKYHPDMTQDEALKKKHNEIIVNVNDEWKKVQIAFEVFGSHRPKQENEDGDIREPSHPQIPIPPEMVQKGKELLNQGVSFLFDLMVNRYTKKI